MTLPTQPRATLRQRAPLTAQRAYRMARALSLTEVALHSGINTCRVSILERFPERAKPGELELLTRAIDELYAERERGAA